MMSDITHDDDIQDQMDADEEIWVTENDILPDDTDEWHHQERMNEDQKEEDHWHKEN